MRKFFSFVKVQLLCMLNFGNMFNSKKRGARAKGGFGLGALLLIGALMVFVGYLYTDIMIDVFALQGTIKDTLPTMLCLTILVCFLLSFSSIGNLLFGFKDYDVLSSMPFSSLTIVIGKLVSIYLFDLIFSILIMAPCIIVYSGIVQLELTSYFTILIMVIFSPLISLSLSVFVGAIISAISSRFRRKNLIQTVLLLIFLVGIFVLSMFSQTILFSISEIYPLTPIFNRGLTEPLYCFFYCLICLTLSFVISFLVAIFYKKINDFMNTKKASKKFVLKEQKILNQSKALLKREFKLLFSNATYSINSLMGIIMPIVLSVVFIVLKYTLFNLPELQGILLVILYFYPAILAFCFLMSPSTSASIACEGSTFWQLKVLPIKAEKIIGIKVLVGVLLYCPISIICSVLVCAFVGVPIWQSILLCATSLLCAFFGVIVGIWLNMCFPFLNWQNKTQAAKQGVANLFQCLISFVLAILLGVGGYFLLSVANGLLYLLIASTGLFILLNLVFVKLVMNKCKRFVKIGE